MALKFFHTPKNKRFDFKPRYYNEQKEEFENRVKHIKREMGLGDPQDEGKPYVPNIKGQMKGYFKKSQKANQTSNIRLIFIILLLAIIAYYLFFA